MSEEPRLSAMSIRKALSEWGTGETEGHESDYEKLVVIVDNLLKEARSKQREMCAASTKKYFDAAMSIGGLDDDMRKYVTRVASDACLNATRENK